MKPEQRSLLAIVLSIGVLILWYMVFSPQATETPETTKQEIVAQEKTPESESVVTKATAAEAAAPVPTAMQGPEKTVSLNTPRFDVSFSNYGARISSVILKDYRAGVGKDSQPVNLVNNVADKASVMKCRHCNASLPPDAEYTVEAQDGRSVRFRWDGPELSVIRQYTIDEDRYLIDQKVTVINRSEGVVEGELGLAWQSRSPPGKSGLFSSFGGGDDGQLSVVYQLGGSLERIRREKKNLEGLERGVIAWTGLESRYFLTALISRQLSEQEVVTYEYIGDDVGTALYYPRLSLRPGDQAELQYSAYMGPKEINDLDVVGVGLDSAIDHGWFAVLAVPILYSLKFFHDYLHSWGLAIILLTIIVKMLLNPLTVKGMKSMKAMQKLQPQLAELREKFKDDKARLNQETMAMFKSHKVNPMGGCLPMLIQMPIYIALYRVLFGSIELRHAPFLFYKDLAAPDPYYVTPILLGIFMVLQQKMTPTASADPMQKKMMMIMPVMFTIFMLFLPMGLVLYILVNTVMTVVQHYMFNHDIRWRDILRGRIKLR